MSNFLRGSAPKDTRRQSGEQDEEATEKPSLQRYSSSDNNQDEDFSERRSPLLHRSSENKIKQQQETQPINNWAPFQQGYPSKDSDYNKSSQIFRHSQQENLVKCPQEYPANCDSPLNNQSSYSDLQHLQSSTKISTSAEQSSKGNLTGAQITYHSPQKDVLAGFTSLTKQPLKEEISYNTLRLPPSGRVQTHPKDNYHQPCNQDADFSEGHSQEMTSVTSLQRNPPKRDSHLNQQSYKISNSQEQSSTNTETTYHLPQQKLLAGATSSLQERRKEHSSGSVHSAPKENNPQPCHQSSSASKHQPPPNSAPSPIKNNHQSSHQPYQEQHLQSPISAPSPIKNNHQSSHQAYQKQPVIPPPGRNNIVDDNTANSGDSKHLWQQQQSDCSQHQPTKQVHPPRDSTTLVQPDVTKDHDLSRSKSSTIKDSPEALKSESVNSRAVPDPRSGSLTEGNTTQQVESSTKNVSKDVPVQRPESNSCCECSIL